MKVLITLLFLSILSFNAYSGTATIGPCQEQICVDYFKEYKKYARLGYSDAMTTLGDMYYFGHGTQQSFKSALKQYKSAAKYGSVKAQYKAGMMYLNLEDFLDLDDGVKYLKKAARSGYIDASLLLGVIYFTPDYYEQDFSEADKWLTKAYEKKHDRAPKFITYMKTTDNFTSKNFPDLFDAIEENPIVLPEKIAADNSQQTSATDSEVKKEEKIEVLTVYGTLTDLFDAQLISLKNTYPEKYAKATGSRIIGRTCAHDLSCGTTDKGQFDKGLERIMGDHAVSMHHEAFRGKAGF